MVIFEEEEKPRRRWRWVILRYALVIILTAVGTWWALRELGYCSPHYGKGPMAVLIGPPFGPTPPPTSTAAPTVEPSSVTESPAPGPAPSDPSGTEPPPTVAPPKITGSFPPSKADAKKALGALEVARNRDSEKYQRDAFGPGWSGQGYYPKIKGGCEARDEVLRRDLAAMKAGDKNRCIIFSGTLTDPYTGKVHEYSRYKPSQIQIDHIVALGAAWRTGASKWKQDRRVQFANDITNMLAVDKKANQDKSSKTPDQWRPQRSYWCGYATRWVGIKSRYGLTITKQEKKALNEMLAECKAG